MSLFNPWVLLALLLAFLGVAAGGYSKGKYSEQQRQQIEIARLNAEARQKEQALVTAVTTQATQLVKANNEAKVLLQKRNLAIDTGALKLRLPVKAPVCPVSTTDDTPAPARDSVQAGAELDPTTARSLVAITDQGDANTRQLNACIDAYNTVYQTLKGKP
jgi:prophage endopeptidase